MIDCRGCNILHQCEKLLRDLHRRAGHIAVNEEDQPAGIALDPCENSLVVDAGAMAVFTRRLRRKLSLASGASLWFDPFAVVGGDRGLRQ
jgi:hypothetical protein